MKKILIIDDDHLYTEGIENSLSAHFAITSVHHFGAIQAALATGAFDVALLDMQLYDGSNGLQSINLLRTANVKIIIVSNTATKEQLRVSLMMGVNGYVHKTSTHSDVKRSLQQIASIIGKPQAAQQVWTQIERGVEEGLLHRRLFLNRRVVR